MARKKVRKAGGRAQAQRQQVHRQQMQRQQMSREQVERQQVERERARRQQEGQRDVLIFFLPDGAGAVEQRAAGTDVAADVF